MRRPVAYIAIRGRQKEKMNRHRASARGLILAAAALIALTTPAHARANAVTQWNLNASNALINTGGQAPPVAGLHLAMVQGAVYDAVNGIDRGYQPYLVSPTANPWDSKDAAVATAAYRVLVNIVPAQQPALLGLYNSSLAAIPDGPAKTGGINAGEEGAAAMTAARTNDGRFGPFRFTIGTTPGAWRPTLPMFVNDPNAWLKDVKPFLIESSSQFRTKGPHALTSNQYAKEFAEVKAIGSATSATRTADQTLAANYWAEHPVRTWSRIVRTLATQQNVSTVDSARLFAMVYLTAADSAITVWEDKARWSFWRPITAIREADTDGNPKTEKDASWLPLIANPPYPDHPSGHLGLSGSMCETLKDFFGGNKMAWSDTNNAGLSRSYTHFSQAVDEITDLRVWSGIHFRAADEQAARIGKQVAKYRDKHYFKPLHGRGR
jgi:hypothetical protein